MALLPLNLVVNLLHGQSCLSPSQPHLWSPTHDSVNPSHSFVNGLIYRKTNKQRQAPKPHNTGARLFCLKKHMSTVGRKRKLDWSFLLWIATLLNVFHYRSVLQNTNRFRQYFKMASLHASLAFVFLYFGEIITLALKWAVGEGLERWGQWKSWTCLYDCKSWGKATKMKGDMKKKSCSTGNSCQHIQQSAGSLWISADFLPYAKLIPEPPPQQESVGHLGKCLGHLLFPFHTSQ